MLARDILDQLLQSLGPLLGVLVGFFLSALRDRWVERRTRRQIAAALYSELAALSMRHQFVGYPQKGWKCEGGVPSS